MLLALRDRELGLQEDVAEARALLQVLEARLAELRAVITLVQRGGRLKPGPKLGSKRRPRSEEPDVPDDAIKDDAIKDALDAMEHHLQGGYECPS